MTIRPASRSRIRTRAGIGSARRLSPCYRHPEEPATGICASCLRERLSGLDASTALPPELRRCRSVVSTSRCEALNEPRRKSCDVVSARNSLSDLFGVDDFKSGSESEAKVESKNVGLSRVSYTVIGSKSNKQSEIRAVSELDSGCIDSDAEVEEGEFKPMKEYIDLEFGTKAKKSKDLRDIAGNILGAASVFSKKLRKWRQKNSKIKEQKICSDVKLETGNDERKLGESHSEIVGRRSCDIEPPRFSVDAGRISFEEPRASWDGYMIARTIPRLAPMFAENGILGNISRMENHRLSIDGPMHSIIEDESSSGASGSGHSNSDSSFSMRRSSFDRSSSVRSFGKKVTNLEDQLVSPANMKLVITEKELKNWHLNATRDDELEKLGSIPRTPAPPTESVDKLNVPAKKSVRWRKVCNVFGFKHKNREDVCEPFGRKGNSTDHFIDVTSEKQGDGDWKLPRSNSVVGSRKSCDGIASNYRRRSVDNAGLYDFKVRGEFKLERNRSTKYSSADLDDGVTPFYMTPLRSSRNSKSGKFKLQNSHSMSGNILRLN